MIKHYCHRCFRAVKSADELVGEKDVCPHCKATIFVPAKDEGPRVITKRQADEALEVIRRWHEDALRKKPRGGLLASLVRRWHAWRLRKIDSASHDSNKESGT